jgi:hypothetical protein
MMVNIDLNLPLEEFRKQIQHVADDARKKEILLALPCGANSSFIERTALILGQINCDNCNARCCRSVKFAEFGIPFSSSEYKSLEQRVGVEKLPSLNFKLIGKSRYMPTPCAFLHKNRCSIYDIRPLACVLYPIEQRTISDGEK